MNKLTNLSNFNNSNFYVGAGILKRILWYLVSIFFFKSFFHSYSIKRYLLKIFGAKIGLNVIIKPYVNIKYPWNLSIGNNTWIGEQVWIDNLVKVSIGDNVCISQGAMLLCGNHNYKSEKFELIANEIVLENGVWIGAKSVVCGGVICHSHSILTVLSVASKNLNEYTIYKGNPAIEVKKREIE